ncbi:alpha/beta hydrolase [Dyadobacter sp. CY345]|uniref:alpha/beta hydrolase n=1 Tax=Dyadobacter sp. CY345 TaxID=2909335 RepID=UPI001F2E837A|nr:alpha/beta hydrolase [Dyadobacter sp. CY345]MCF2446596.1 alpha/beta hydrolase [Dyadobacter sp. CY345]
MKQKFKIQIRIANGLFLFVMAGVILFSNACTDHSTEPVVNLKPKTPKPEWAPDITDQMWVVIEKLISYQDPPLPTLTPQRARMNHTVKDAVMDLLAENNITPKLPMVDTSGVKIAVYDGVIHARIYKPKTGTGPFPVIVYYHGGGWVIANIDVYDASARALSEKVGAIVVSVGYRKGPEYKFPTAHNDAYQAYGWVVKNIGGMNGDTSKIGVAGESAGGNLAANVSIMARDKGERMPKHQLLVYPVAASDTNTASYIKYSNAKPLDKPSIKWFLMHYLNDVPKESKDTRISIVDADLKNLPPTTIISAQIDPLETEGNTLKEKLEAAGVKVTRKLYQGTTHEFFGTDALVPEAKEAQDYAASEFRTSFKMK